MSSCFVVVTNCTARKRVGVPIATMAPAVGSSSLEVIASRWRERIASTAATVPASHLYVGRSIREAETVAELLQADFFIVSAGLGLVAASDHVPGYDVAAGTGKSGLSDWLKARESSTSEWWREISGDRGFQWLMRQHSQAIVLVALPAEYLRMVGDDLASLPPTAKARLRFFTSPVGRQAVRNGDGLNFIPYDERLESLPGYAGTRSDFPQRALSHFVHELRGHTRTLAAAVRSVETVLSKYKAPKRHVRQRRSDDEICQLIRNGWRGCGGNSARLLRFIRDDKQVACEQSRFAALRRRVAEELGGDVASKEASRVK